jgi:hypothetical protein
MTKIRVKIGQSEAEVEADPEHLRDAIELIPELLTKLPKTGREASEQKPLPEATMETLDRQLSSQFPIVNLEKGDSLADVIGKFFSGPWGRDKRKLSDVRGALQSYGLNYPKQSVAVALLRLAKTSKLRRFKAEDGEYVYTSAINLAGVSHEGTEHVLDELAATSPS